MFVDSFDSLGKKIESAQKEFQYLTSTRQNQLDKRLEKIDDLRQQGKLKSDDPVDDWLLPSDEE